MLKINMLPWRWKEWKLNLTHIHLKNSQLKSHIFSSVSIEMLNLSKNWRFTLTSSWLENFRILPTNGSSSVDWGTFFRSVNFKLIAQGMFSISIHCCYYLNPFRLFMMLLGGWLKFRNNWNNSTENKLF